MRSRGAGDKRLPSEPAAPDSGTSASAGAGSPRTPLRILIADDHEVVRHGVRGLLESRGWIVVGEAADGREAVEKATSFAPDLVVLDVAMPLLNGLESARQIRKAVPACQILILTMYDSERMARSVLEAGAHGYVLKSDAARQLISAVETLSQHRPYFTGQVSQMLLDSYLSGGSRDPHNPPAGWKLTAREREIVQLLAEGKSNKEVATLLNIAVKTVATHRSNLSRKLGIHGLSELIHYAIRNNLVEP